jgi:hypothetical protein
MVTANGKDPPLYRDAFLSYPSYFITRLSPYRSTLYGLAIAGVVKYPAKKYVLSLQFSPILTHLVLSAAVPLAFTAAAYYSSFLFIFLFPSYTGPLYLLPFPSLSNDNCGSTHPVTPST